MTGIDYKTGIINTNGITEGCQSYTTHPVSGINLNGFQIPDWDNLIQVCKDAANMLPSVRYIGWDMVHTDEYGWVIMEANHLGEFLCQLVNGKGVKQEFEEIIGWKPNKEFWWQ